MAADTAILAADCTGLPANVGTLDSFSRINANSRVGLERALQPLRISWLMSRLVDRQRP